MLGAGVGSGPQRRPQTMNATSEMYSFSGLWRDYHNCRRNKRNTSNALRFEIWEIRGS